MEEPNPDTAVSMTVVLGGDLLLAPAPIAAPAVATMLSLVLMRLAHQTAGARALRTLTLVISHADKWLHKAVPSTSSRAGGGGVLVLEGYFVRGRDAAELRVFVQQEPAERGGLTGAVFGCAGL